MMNDKKDKLHDDGRTIADMSGLDCGNSFFRLKKSKQEHWEKQDDDFSTQLSKEERRAYVFSSMLTALFIGLIYVVIFGVVIFLFVKVIC